jgi:proline dehydrogenase
VTDAVINGADPSKPFADAMDIIVSRAIVQNTRTFVDAEQNEFQQAINKWTVNLMRRYTETVKSSSSIPCKHTSKRFGRNSNTNSHSRMRKDGRWQSNLCAAYIDSDPRQIIHDTKDQMNDCYDGIVHDALTRNMAGISKSDFPHIDLFLADHNSKSVANANVLIQELAARGELKTVPEFGQLQVMCDELGCKILQE